MAHWINYIWQSTFCLLFFFGIYWCFLKNEKAFGITRIFLLVTPLLAMVFPLVEIPVSFSKPSISLENTVFLQTLSQLTPEEEVVGTVGLPEFTVQSTKLPIILEWKDYFVLGYMTIVLLLSTRLLWQLLQLRLLLEKGWYQTIYRLKGGYFLIPTFGLAPVFSFFNKLFWDDTQSLSPEEDEHIIKHELEHIRQGHSWDRMYYQILSIIFWFNPVIHLMRVALIDNHEYSADEKVLNQTQNQASYTNLIVKIAFKGLDLPVGNHFIRSTTLKRIMMMNKQNKVNQFKLFMVFPLTIMLLALVSMKTIGGKEILDNLNGFPLTKLQEQISLAQDSIEVSAKVKRIKNPIHYEYVSELKNGKVTAQIGELQYEISQISDDEEYRKVMEMLDVFKDQTNFKKTYDIPSIIADPDENAKPVDGIQTWARFLSEHLQPTEEAKKMGVSGVMYVEFIVDKEGEIKQPTIRKSLGMGLDDKVLRLLLSDKLPKWVPAQLDGEPVNSKFTMPVRIEDQQVAERERFFPEGKNAPKRMAPQKIDGGEVFDEVDEMPVPSGGREGWNKYVAKNIKYPTEAREKGIQGTVYATFVVNKEGELVNPKILRGIGGGADEEALLIIKNAENWTPGKQRGTPVPVRVRLPIRFKLDGVNSRNQTPAYNFPNQLDEIVVVGYGKQKERSLPELPTIIKHTEQDKKPLIYINGEKQDHDSLNQLDPKSIESISVLKEKGATELYGSNAKNGVILIVTKQD